MRLLQRRRRPRTKTIRAADGYLFAGAEQARQLNHNYIGTEHILSLLVRDPDGAATRVLAQLRVTADAVERVLRAGWRTGRRVPGSIRRRWPRSESTSRPCAGSLSRNLNRAHSSAPAPAVSASAHD